jgi:prepilin signal peptidase PulO-like enzyme (type II secretory pathway)
MNNIYPYLIVIVIGLFSAAIVNFVSDKLFLQRSAYPDKFSPSVQRDFWRKYFFSPWKLAAIKKHHVIRIIVLYPIYIFITWWLYFSPENYVSLLWGICLLIYFGIVIVMDLEEKVVLFPVAKAGVVIGFIWGISARGIVTTLIGGVVGYLVMFSLYKFGEYFILYLSKKRGNTIDEIALGYGDVMMGGIIGLILGFPGIVPGLVLGIFIGGVISGLLLLVSIVTRKYQAFVAIPYAPFLVIGAVLILFFKDLF